MISLNASATYLWEQVEGKDFGVEDLVRLLLDKYDVEESVARRDAQAFVRTLVETGLVEGE